jgi:hypothetical protein
MIVLDNSLEKYKIQKLYDALVINNTKISNIQETEQSNKYNIYYTLNITKLLTYIIEKLCINYFELKKIKPHIIISNHESTYLYKICKYLLSKDIIELSVITNTYNIIDSFKLAKKLNTFICIISPLNIAYGTIHNITRLYNICKYYKILLFSNICNNYTNLHDINYYINNQDILSVNDITVKYKNQTIKLYKIFIYKNISIKLEDSLIKIPNQIMYYNKLILKNIFTLKKEYNTKIKTQHQYVIDSLKEYYNVISYNDFVSTKNKNIFNNYCTILAFNFKHEFPLYNHLILSIYMPNVKFTQTSIINYFEQNNIILQTNYNNLIKDLDKSISRGLIHIQFDMFTKSSDLVKFIKVLLYYISELEKLNKVKKSNIKKKVKFSSPECLSLQKNKTTIIKSILKK